MNRQLKFRVWDKTDKTFSENYLIGGGLVFKAMLPMAIPVVDERVIVQQFTGLFDKDGREIYEGDIVSGADSYKELDKDYLGEIKWHHSYWGLGQYKLFVFEDDSLKVLGNVLQNPELLKA